MRSQRLGLLMCRAALPVGPDLNKEVLARRFTSRHDITISRRGEASHDEGVRRARRGAEVGAKMSVELITINCDVQNMSLMGMTTGQVLDALFPGLRLQPKVRKVNDAMAAVRPSPENSMHILPISLLSFDHIYLTS